MKTALILAMVAGVAAAAPPVVPFETDAPLTSDNPIDTVVLAHLTKRGIEPAALCSDAVFLRRAHLDVIGTLPTAGEARAFLADKDPNKRSVLIDRLLQREEFADYWALKWCDLLRVKAEFPVNLWPNAVQAYHRWVRQSIKENKPYDTFVRELLTSSGSNFRVPPVNFYRAAQSKEPEALARAAALTFMGVRAETWPTDRLAGLAGCFSQVGFKPTREWKEEIVFWDRSKAAAPVVFPDGKKAAGIGTRDGREVFADWLIAPENPWFTRNIANRMWYWLMGRGIIHEPDDIRAGNPPVNPELLALLQRELVKSKYDTRHLFRLILNSKTYQLSSIPRGKRKVAVANFACYRVRRLDAEVLIDALCKISGTTEKYSSAIPEPFTFIPEKTRSIALADGSITSSFLVMFGRPSRDSGLESERNNTFTPPQRLHMLNSSHVQNKIIRSVARMRLPRFRGKPQTAIDEVYLTILSRYPTPQELLAIKTYKQEHTPKPAELVMDMAWSLVNSDEFLHRH